MRNKPIVGVGALIFRDKKILLGKRLSKLGLASWGLVGGHLEFGETLEDAIKREIREEIGLVAISLKLICVSNIIAYEKHYVDFEFEAEVEPGEPKLLEQKKFEKWQWCDLKNLPTPLFKAAELALRSYKTGKIYNA